MATLHRRRATRKSSEHETTPRSVTVHQEPMRRRVEHTCMQDASIQILKSINVRLVQSSGSHRRRPIVAYNRVRLTGRAAWRARWCAQPCWASRGFDKRSNLPCEFPKWSNVPVKFLRSNVVKCGQFFPPNKKSTTRLCARAPCHCRLRGCCRVGVPWLLRLRGYRVLGGRGPSLSFGPAP